MTTDPLVPYVPQVLRHRVDPQAGTWRAEGTLVLADVTGFTRVTEKLSHQGKRGAEEMVGTISSVFTALLESSTDGGDVLKFGGDSMLLFYDGEDHAQRGCHAALTMQRVLRRVGGIDTSRGRVRVRMSMGAHSGTFHFLLCGGDHLELHVLGPDATTTTRLEAAAGAGEVVVSAATANGLDGVRTDVRPDGLMRVRAVPPLPPVENPVQSGGASMARFVSPLLRDHLVGADLESEHRRATIAFAHFGGVDDLLAADADEEAFDRVQALTTEVMAALDDYDVLLTSTDIGADGGAFMLTAGAPRTTGDEDVRMLRVVRRLVATASGLPVRAGVNAGNVFVGAVGAPHRRTYATMGDATNLAARVMTRAEPGTVLATRTVTAAAANRFGLTPMPAFHAKGKRRPVPVARVGETTAPSTGSVSDAPLVGREEHLEQLLACLADARAGRGRVVELVGGQGVGKSRLVAELRARAEDVTWLALACEPYEQSSPFSTGRRLLARVLELAPDADATTWARSLATVVADRAPHLRPWLPLIADVLGVPAEPTEATSELAADFRGERTAQATAALLAAVPDGVTVLVLEDTTPMDDASAELATELVRRVSELPWLVVVTRQDRAEGLHAGRGYVATHLEVQPLGPEATAELCARLAERSPVPPHLVPDLVERSAGNPMVLEALVATLASTDTEAGLPTSVEAIFAARIDALNDEDRRALRYLSVLGDRFDLALAHAALDGVGVPIADDALWRRLDGLVSRSDGVAAFRTGLIRQVAYEGLPYRRRRELHGLVATTLADGDDEASAALHLTRAGRWGPAWTAAVAAGHDAGRRGAHAVAGELFDLALTAAPHLSDLDTEEWFEVGLAAGDAWTRAGVNDRALRAYSQARAAGPDQAGRIELMLRRARVHEHAGRYAHALQMYGRARSALDDLPAGAARQRLHARAEAGYASARLGQGRPDDAIDHGEAAVVAATDADARSLLAHAHHLLDRAHMALDDPEAAARHRDLALPLFAAAGDLLAQGTVLHDLGADARRLGQLEVALWMYERSQDARTRAGDIIRAASSGNAIGEVLLELGRVDEAAERFSQALRAWRGARSLPGVALALSNIGATALLSNDPEEAIRRLQEALDCAVEVGADGLLARTRVLLGEALLESGRLVEAWEAATMALAAGGDLGPAGRGRAHECRACALERTGGTRRAAIEHAAALDAASQGRSPPAPGGLGGLAP